MYRVVENRYDYELTDHLGNVRAVISGVKVNTRADVLEYADYYALGSVARSGGTMQYRYGYQGQYAERDKETEWNSFELRQYDAVIGRWLSPDPYGQYNSPYVAMGNDWPNGVDPDGGWVSTFSVGWAAVGAGVGAGVGALVDPNFKDNWWKWTLGGAAVGGVAGSDWAKLNIWDDAGKGGVGKRFMKDGLDGGQPGRELVRARPPGGTPYVPTPTSTIGPDVIGRKSYLIGLLEGKGIQVAEPAIRQITVNITNNPTQKSVTKVTPPPARAVSWTIANYTSRMDPNDAIRSIQDRMNVLNVQNPRNVNYFARPGISPPSYLRGFRRWGAPVDPQSFNNPPSRSVPNMFQIWITPPRGFRGSVITR